MKNVVIVAGSRIPFTKSFTNYAKKTGQELMTHALKDLVNKMNLQKIQSFRKASKLL